MGLYIPTNKVIFLKKYIYFSFACLFTINLFSQSLNPDFFTDNINEDELNDFIDSMTNDQLQLIMDFFDTMPKLRHVIKVTNPNTKVENEIVLEGLSSFFE